MAFAAPIIGILACVVFGYAVYTMVNTGLGMAGRTVQASATRRRVADSASSGAEHAQSSSTVPETGIIARSLESSESGRRLRTLIISAGVSAQPAAFVSRILLASSGLFFVGWLVGRGPFAGLVLAIGTCVGSYFWVQGAAEKRLDRLRAQLPDAFTLVGNSLASGLSLVQALEYAARETEAPLGPELWGLVNDVAAGISLPSALERFRATVPLRELRTISTAMEIQHRVGGNMREMLEQATTAVRQSLEMAMSLKAQTAQGRLSAKIVGIMPLGLLGVVSLMQKGYIEDFVGSPVGVVMLVVALAADLAGFLIIQRIMDIET